MGTAWRIFGERKGKAQQGDAFLRSWILRVSIDQSGLLLDDLCDIAPCSRTTAHAHLRKLREEGAIELRRTAEGIRVFAARHEQAGPGLGVLRGTTARRVATAIVEKPGVGIMDVVEELGESPQVVYYHVKRLAEAGLLLPASQPRHRKLHASPALVRLLRSPLPQRFEALGSHRSAARAEPLVRCSRAPPAFVEARTILSTVKERYSGSEQGREIVARVEAALADADAMPDEDQRRRAVSAVEDLDMGRRARAEFRETISLTPDASAEKLRRGIGTRFRACPPDAGFHEATHRKTSLDRLVETCRPLVDGRAASPPLHDLLAFLRSIDWSTENVGSEPAWRVHGHRLYPADLVVVGCWAVEMARWGYPEAAEASLHRLAQAHPPTRLWVGLLLGTLRAYHGEPPDEPLDWGRQWQQDAWLPPCSFVGEMVRWWPEAWSAPLAQWFCEDDLGRAPSFAPVLLAAARHAAARGDRKGARQWLRRIDLPRLEAHDQDAARVVRSLGYLLDEPKSMLARFYRTRTRRA